MKRNKQVHNLRSFLEITCKIGLMTTIVVAIACNSPQTPPPDLTPHPVSPSPLLVDYQEMELIGFLHFTMNTFTGKEWGFGDEDPALFNPTELDAEQWAITAKEAGLKQLILTAKHHDGFCLWPSEFTEHSLKNSPYKDGNGDLVKEFVEACRKHGLNVGLYLSPWDRNHPKYGQPEYITYYRNQLRELLTNYGEINEIWFDGANGGDGYYGGANEVRKIDRKTYYQWDKTFAFVKELQPNIKIFSDAGPDVHWIGNEKGFAGETFWSTMHTDSVYIGMANTKYLNTGDPNGNRWIVGQCDVSIRPGWFYHPEEDSLVKTPEQLTDIYLKSVGRNAILLLNIPPDQRGLIHENDIRALQGFTAIRKKMFEVNVAQGATATASNTRLNHPKFSPDQVLDGDTDTYWATEDSESTAELIIQLEEENQFDLVVVQEPIQFGQRIGEFSIAVSQDGNWEEVYRGTTIGYKRIINIPPVTASQIKLHITAANNPIAIANVEVYHSHVE